MILRVSRYSFSVSIRSLRGFPDEFPEVGLAEEGV
jgi:hypothetical protein